MRGCVHTDEISLKPLSFPFHQMEWPVDIPHSDWQQLQCNCHGIEALMSRTQESNALHQWSSSFVYGASRTGIQNPHLTSYAGVHVCNAGGFVSSNFGKWGSVLRQFFFGMASFPLGLVYCWICHFFCPTSELCTAHHRFSLKCMDVECYDSIMVQPSLVCFCTLFYPRKLGFLIIQRPFCFVPLTLDKYKSRVHLIFRPTSNTCKNGAQTIGLYGFWVYALCSRYASANR